MTSREKLKRANKVYKEAKSLVSVNPFALKFSKDWNGAAPLFEQAALLFKNADALKMSVECFTLAGECNEKCDNLVMSGKNYDQAAQILLSLHQIQGAIKLWEKSHRVFYEDGKPERAMEVLVKAAQSLEKEDKKKNGSDPIYVDDIIKLYERSIGIMQQNDKLHFGMSTFNKMNLYLVNHKLYDKAAENLKLQRNSFRSLEQEHNIWKANLALVVVMLAKGDLGKADLFHREVQHEDQKYNRTEESLVAEQLLVAAEEKDNEALERLQKEARVKYIEPAFARLLKRMKSFDHVKGKRNQSGVISGTGFSDQKNELFSVNGGKTSKGEEEETDEEKEGEEDEEEEGEDDSNM